jgi:phage-related holin
MWKWIKKIMRIQTTTIANGLNRWLWNQNTETKTILMVYFRNREMDKSIQLSLFVKHSPRINSRAVCVEMDKKIMIIQMPIIANGLNRGL